METQFSFVATELAKDIIETLTNSSVSAFNTVTKKVA